MLENIRLSFQGIWSHKMRSFLTMLGIIIGIGAIIAIVSTIQGTNEQIKQNLVGAGNNTVTVQLYQDEWTYEMDYNGIPDGVPVISDDTMQQILAADGVEDASRYTSRQGYDTVCYGNTSLSGGYVMGIDQNYLDTCSYAVKEGRGFDGNDYAKYSNFGSGLCLLSVSGRRCYWKNHRNIRGAVHCYRNCRQKRWL